MNITLDPNAQVGLTSASGLGTLSGVKKTESASQSTETDSAVISAVNVDKVELSESAIQYLEDESSEDTASSETDTEDETSVSETLSQTDDDDDVLASELYSYTETELQELLLDGTITRSEYDAERAKRSAGIADE